MKRSIASIVTILILIFCSSALAEVKTFVKEYSYQASDEDSKNSSRTLALREVKRLLLEELGTYLESVTEVQNFQLTKDQITTLTAGIVKTEIVDEKWDGRTYWLKSKIVADSDQVTKSINTLRQDRLKTKELEGVKRRLEEQLREIERLRKELKVAKGEKREKQKTIYSEAIKNLTAAEWYEEGNMHYASGNYSDALDAFSKAIILMPKDYASYHDRGVVYSKIGNYRQALNDFDRAIELNPSEAVSYYGRGLIYSTQGSYIQAIDNFDKTVELDPKYALSYYCRGSAYGKLGKYGQAIENYSKAIELNPKDSASYNGRGLVYARTGSYGQAIRDFDRSIALDPKNASAYSNRGLVYWFPGTYQKALVDLKTAARLGNEGAQGFLRSQNIDW